MTFVPTAEISEVAALPNHPIILRSHRPALACETLRDLLAATGFPVLSGYHEGEICEYADLNSEEMLEAFESGRLTLNMANSTIAKTSDPDERLTIPAQIDDCNLFNFHDATLRLRKCLVISQGGSYTRLHVDAWGMAGWMYLYHGRKRWHLWEPVFVPLLYDQINERYYDEDAGHAHPDPRCRALIEALPRWEGEIGPGELLWFPEGWAHRVWTTEDAFGFGGASLHYGRLDQALRSWLWEKRLGFADVFDYLDLLRDAAAHGFDTAPFIQRVQDTLALWLRNRE